MTKEELTDEEILDGLAKIARLSNLLLLLKNKDVSPVQAVEEYKRIINNAL